MHPETLKYRKCQQLTVKKNIGGGEIVRQETRILFQLTKNKLLREETQCINAISISKD